MHIAIAYSYIGSMYYLLLMPVDMFAYRLRGMLGVVLDEVIKYMGVTP